MKRLIVAFGLSAVAFSAAALEAGPRTPWANDERPAGIPVERSGSM